MLGQGKVYDGTLKDEHGIRGNLLFTIPRDNQLEIGRNIDIFFTLVECQSMWIFHCETFLMYKYTKSIIKILY